MDLKTQRLTCWEGNKLVYSFPCSSGRDGRLTPTGTYQVEEKMANWGWKDTLDFCDCGPTMPFKADHRKGELFPRGNWAIHGWPKDETTNKWLDSPDLVGKQRFSDGCVELLRSDDKKVYDWASIGTPVIIR
ncbi:L,D-transpeptidase [Patescibacteria group bacterium]|nr:L,D-transpeptidase [Patescibacteria group bacterium]